MRPTRLILASCVCALALFGCDKPTQQPDDPAESIDEVHEPDTTESSAEPDGSPAKEPEEAYVEDEPRIDEALLWRVEGKNGSTYLFGTIHGGIDGIQWSDFPAYTREAFDTSKVLVLEANLDKVDQQHVAKATMLPSDKSLKEMLGEERFQKLVKQTGQPGMVLDLLRPWAAYAEMTRKMIGPGEPVDELVKIEARVETMDVAYLETTTQQIDFLSQAVDVELLKTTLDELDKMIELKDKMMAFYRAGDPNGLAKMTFIPKYVEQHPKMYEILFDQRNKAWVPKIEGFIEKGDHFVAVGAGHLIGETSVIKLLEKKGHKITRVMPEPQSPSAESAAE